MRNLFKYIEVHYSRENFASKWKRILEADIDKHLRSRIGNYNCFATIQRFKNPIEQEDELQWVPIYFDFDSDDNLQEAIDDVLKVIEYFSGLGINKEYVRVWFSGNRGFHITIEPELFGIQPHPELTYQIKLACQYVANFLNLRTFDERVYSIKRMWRLPDSIHQKTRLFCIELDHSELAKGVDYIRERAKEPKGQLYQDIEYTDIRQEPELVSWWQEFLRQYEDIKDLQRNCPRKPITKTEEDPVCIRDLLDNFIRKAGTRNQACLVLAGYFKDIGLTKEQAYQKIYDWAEAIPNELAKTKGKKLQAEIRSILTTIYNPALQAGRDDKYHFACSYIKALGSGTDKPIACDFDNCKTAKPEDQETDTPIELKLWEASRACYTGKKLSIEAVVSGKDSAPYIIPGHIIVTCLPELSRSNSPCKGCQIASLAGRYEFKFSPKDQQLLELIDSSKDQQIGILKKKASIPQRCNRVKFEIINHINVTEVQLIPHIEFKPETMHLKDEYVVRRGFFVGHDIQSNASYRIIAYTYPEPKKQYAVHIFSEIDLLQGAIGGFVMTKELYEMLKIFQSDNPKEKFTDVHQDLEENITHIWQRRDMAIGIDLVYHSPLSFYLQGEFVTRGWGELLIIGDSGQAKSTLAERLIQHYGLGEIIGGETASRTGLTYNLQQRSNNHWFLQWTALPLNDRGCLTIDEFGGIPAEVMEELSRVRSTGIVEVNRIIQAKTPARTRKIFLSNTKDGRMLSSYNNGVEAIDKLFNKKEDIRRLDLAITVASGEVSEDILNQLHKSKVPHRYNTYLCKNLILWIWSRQPQQIIIDDETTKAILDVASWLSHRYHPNIPLVEPADMRFKVSRLSIACAGRLFSTDDGQRLIVLPYHVEFIREFLDIVYRKSSMGYDLYSEVLKKRSFLSEVKKMEITNFIKQQPDWQLLVDLLLEYKAFKKSVLIEQWGCEDKEVAKDLFKILSKNRLIESIPIGYVKSPVFIELLKELNYEEPEWTK